MEASLTKRVYFKQSGFGYGHPNREDRSSLVLRIYDILVLRSLRHYRDLTFLEARKWGDGGFFVQEGFSDVDYCKRHLLDKGRGKKMFEWRLWLLLPHQKKQFLGMQRRHSLDLGSSILYLEENKERLFSIH